MSSCKRPRTALRLCMLLFSGDVALEIESTDGSRQLTVATGLTQDRDRQEHRECADSDPPKQLQF